MARNDPYFVHDTLDDTQELSIDGGQAGTGAAEITELGGGEDAEVYRDVDTNGDGTYDESHLIDEVVGEWHSQLNELIVSESENTRLRIVNISGENSVFYYASGIEVDN